ncbi:HAD family hydrolase [Streptomyces sp. NPDC000983]|uniref:HAD family hydrolase n=1 Tax=Streptomyces sp. NPDC000983 TaxID=3154373 RepID=UPI00332E88EF
MTTKRAAVFDIDGTLVDTNYLHAVAWWESFRQAGHRVPLRDIHRAVGLSGGDLLDHLLGEDRDHDQDQQITGAHYTLYATHFERLSALAGAGELLRTLAGRDWGIVLATSASGAELSALRGVIDADDVVLGVTSADDVADGKPAPDPVRQARELADVPSEHAVFVGDSVWDMEAAARDGVVPVAVLSGGIPRADLEAAGAHAVYRDTADLLAHLDQSPFADTP